MIAFVRRTIPSASGALAAAVACAGAVAAREFIMSRDRHVVGILLRRERDRALRCPRERSIQGKV
jgi:hypothetical protein